MWIVDGNHWHHHQLLLITCPIYLEALCRCHFIIFSSTRLKILRKKWVPIHNRSASIEYWIDYYYYLFQSIEQINQNACSGLNLNSLSSSLLSATNILNQALPSTQTSNNNESQQQEIQDTFDINTPCSTSINAIQSVNCVYKSKNLPTETVVAASVVHLKPKKKKKKRQIKEKKIQQKPGEIHLTTALDGSTLYCCPECQMAYPEKSLLDQHLVGHKLERRSVLHIIFFRAHSFLNYWTDSFVIYVTLHWNEKII